VIDLVENMAAIPMLVHETGHTQLGQVLRDGGLWHSDQLSQVINGLLALKQRQQDSQPGRVSKHPKRLHGGSQPILSRKLDAGGLDLPLASVLRGRVSG
jgi:hypothetical protein